MLARWGLVFVFVVLGMALAACYDSAANNSATSTGAASNSAIVQKLKAAGAGDVSAVSERALGQWLVQHKELAGEIAEACIPVRKDAPASWGDSVEAKVCNVAAIAAPFKPIVGTGKTY